MDEAGDIFGLVFSTIYIPISLEYAINNAIVHFDKHYLLVVTFHDNFFDCAKFNTTPFFALIAAAEKDNNQPRTFSVYILQQCVE